MNIKTLFKKNWYYFPVILLIIGVFIWFYYSTEKSGAIIKTSKKMSLDLKPKEIVTTTGIIKKVFVEVKGAVVTPGVYELDESKRVIDAVNASGGLIKSSDTSNINMSMHLKDEMLIIVYTKNELYNYKLKNGYTIPKCVVNECVCPNLTNDACIKKPDLNDKIKMISINSATKEELMTLSGIGESKALAIITYRKEKGPFQKIEDVKNVSGIGDAMYEKIKDNITI
ncbi:MAG: helix-hairpin-helix domain-containing protein [Bacilli bacterium]